MSLDSRIVELADDQSQFAGPELLPVRLAKACAAVLPIAGAGLSLFTSSDFRVPIGASDDMAADAERLQFTVGEGPCLAAHAQGRVITSDADDMRRSWPRFYDQLVADSDYRSIISVPLQQGLQGFAALDLYLTDPVAGIYGAGPGLVTVAQTLAAVLLDEPVEADDLRGGGPAWLDSPAARSRSTVWTAIGMINVGLHLSTVDALAVLRGYGYSHDTSVDDIAARLTSRRLAVDALYQDS